MTDNADVLITFKEYPHVDGRERARELFELCVATHEGTIRPVMAVYDCRMVNMWRTPVEPMRSIVSEMQAAEGQDGVLSVSFGHGFPWGDVPAASAKVLVVSDADEAKAQHTARHFGERLWQQRDEAVGVTVKPEDALDALACAERGPVVLADVADNAGGGAPSDSTFLLQAVLERGLTNVLTGYYWDPLAVRFCEEAGEGATLDLRIGGKCGATSGAPIDLRVNIQRILDDGRQSFGTADNQMGTTVWLRAIDSRVESLDIVLNTIRTQVFHPNGFEQLGLDLSAKHGIIVKSTQHFYAGFSPLASKVIYVSGQGAIPADFANIPFERFTDPYWPRVENPFAR